MANTHRLGARQMLARRIVVIRNVNEQSSVHIPIRVHIEAPQLTHAGRMNQQIDDVQRIERQLLVNHVPTELRLTAGDQRPDVRQLLDDPLDATILPDGLGRVIARQHRTIIVGALNGHGRIEQLEVGA